MQVTLTKELEKLVKEKVASGRYADASDVMRDALRTLELRDDFESPALEAAILEGVRSPRRPYGPQTLERIRKAARSGK
jgi:antitoxin ParD1/3/4